jgi:hypothetical protein
MMAVCLASSMATQAEKSFNELRESFVSISLMTRIEPAMQLIALYTLRDSPRFSAAT